MAVKNSITSSFTYYYFWWMNTRGDIDIGGFGIGSNFSWNVIAAVSYQLSELVAVTAGYRYFYVDYEDDDATEFAYDVGTNGPGLGVTFSF